MQIKRQSHFKDEKQDFLFLNNWVSKLEKANDRKFERIELATALGKTHVWGINTKENAETLVIFPGARTTSLFWDFDKGLDNIGLNLSIFMVETNGLPNFSNGATPDIKALDYGHWANEVLDKLNLKSVYVAGASFGGLICMKLGITNPGKIKAAFLLNPGCLQPFSMKWSNLYYNLLPIIKPTDKNVLAFLNKAIFSKPNHQLSPQAEKLIIEYEVFALTRYKDNTQKPYYMDKQLADVKVDAYLLEGNKDLLFPYQKSIDNANKNIKTLKDVKVFENVGHGIETYKEAMKYIGETIKKLSEPTNNIV
ncbi:alpha/beta fold hydrolase [Pinibacter soli]|uniref:Alpha/beta fold hydrolase n=1 Tax=Pinibacter soli TaxID=3044211 RepID=A0ABT6R9M2_9BACT|nr:alpha/beta fold hydrolase [Pinibacter soli]MDI3319252.1 alpha/beta fold hydrolase [Pinibacter soli]